ncbi:MAG: hypothetical protein WAV40_00790 [Microgenomates group bacterium]
MKFSLRLLYLYLFSFVGLLITVIGSIQIVDLTLKTYVFKVSDYSYPITPIIDPAGKETMSIADQQRQQEVESNAQRKRNLSTALAMIAIGTPLYLYHWGTIKKENKSG